MPTYCLIDDKGRTAEAVMSHKELVVRTDPITGRIDWRGKEWDRDYGAEMGSKKSGEVWRDHWSEGAAVHPEQIPEAVAYDREHGVSVDYDREGRPHFSSALQQRDYLRAHGIHNRDGGYTS